MIPIIEGLSPLAKKLAGEGLKIGAAELAGPVAVGFVLVECFDRYATASEQAALTKAQGILGCNHLQICTHGGYTSATDMIAMVKEKLGCAFLYDKVALWHPQATLDVAALSKVVWRYDSSTGLVGRSFSELSRCSVCATRHK